MNCIWTSESSNWFYAVAVPKIVADVARLRVCSTGFSRFSRKFRLKAPKGGTTEKAATLTDAWARASNCNRVLAVCNSDSRVRWPSYDFHVADVARLRASVGLKPQTDANKREYKSWVFIRRCVGRHIDRSVLFLICSRRGHSSTVRHKPLVVAATTQVELPFCWVA